MIVTVILAGVPDGIPVVVDDAGLTKLRDLMVPSRKALRWTGPTADGGTVTIAADMITAVHVPAAKTQAARKR
jgi:hypothetical protein